MSQHESPHQPPYSFGRDRYRDPQHNDSAQYSDSAQFSYSQQYGAAQQYSGGVPGRVHGARGELVPPPPPGHRSLFTVVILYLVLGFMLLWTGASVAGTLEAIGEQDGTQSMIGMFMSAGSLAITAALGAWLIRIHRRRASYRRIMDAHYAQRFGHHPDEM